MCWPSWEYTAVVTSALTGPEKEPFKRLVRTVSMMVPWKRRKDFPVACCRPGSSVFFDDVAGSFSSGCGLGTGACCGGCSVDISAAFCASINCRTSASSAAGVVAGAEFGWSFRNDSAMLDAFRLSSSRLRRSIRAVSSGETERAGGAAEGAAGAYGFWVGFCCAALRRSASARICSARARS